MSELLIEQESLENGGVRLRLEGVLDGNGAYLLRERLTGLEGPIALDFSRLQRLSDFGLGLVAMAVADMPQEVSFLGLGRHGQQILRAFGVRIAA